MMIYLVWTQYGEDTVGAFSTHDKAIQYLRNGGCTNSQDHEHPDGYRCGVDARHLDHPEKDK